MPKDDRPNSHIELDSLARCRTVVRVVLIVANSQTAGIPWKMAAHRYVAIDAASLRNNDPTESVRYLAIDVDAGAVAKRV